MFSGDGFGFNLAIFEGFFIKDKILNMSDVHDEKLHDFTEDSTFQFLAHTVRLFNPLQVSVQEIHDIQSGADESEIFKFHGYFTPIHL